MSKNEKKTRFVCELPHQQSELLTVKERSNGGLVIVLKAGEQFIPGFDAEVTGIIESQKYSVHRSSDDGRTTVLHHTLLLTNGIKHDGMAQQKDSAGRFIWPMFVRACPDLGSPRYAVESRRRDEIVVAAKFRNRTILVYAVIVSSREFDAQKRFTPAPITARFKHYDVSLFCRFLWAPPSPQGSLIHISTNLPRVNDEFVHGDMRGLPTQALFTPEMLPAQLTHAFESVRMAHLGRIRSWLSEGHRGMLDSPAVGQLFARPPPFDEL